MTLAFPLFSVRDFTFLSDDSLFHGVVNFFLSKSFNKCIRILVLVNGSARLCLNKRKGTSSSSAFYYKSFIVYKSIISCFSVLINPLVRILNNHKLSLIIVKGIACIHILCRSYLTVYFISNASANAIISVSNTDQFTRFALYSSQYNGWYCFFRLLER